MTVGSRIREFRKRLGLSVDDVAEKLGKNRATIYRYESDDIENLPAPSKSFTYNPRRTDGVGIATNSYIKRIFHCSSNKY